MPSVPIQLLLRPLVPNLTSFHGGSSSHRLKRMEKSDRRALNFIRESGIVDGHKLSVCDLVNAVDESLNIEDVGEESLNIKDFVEESLNLKDVGQEYVGIKNVGEVEHASSNEEIISGMEERDACEGPKAQQGKITQKCLNKCVTFPNANGVLPRNASSDMAEEVPKTAMQTPFVEERLHQAYSRSVSLPAPSKLLSAMKGSREKEGLSPGKLTVTWAPDVYDRLLHRCRTQLQARNSRS
ncbi:uncharacterized protein Pyn_07868 [Prunus yedoensis var. nudiflora]|uniref:Uncharacterized protein n=1 Tax=Prunus yedoensis var. nudiflora TaxID=2094558 RepID=A0A314UVH6_PRUYE|nr:uncharacterized protein Pyn_07868 [Prunus yedoensis var. nudiflora]